MSYIGSDVERSRSGGAARSNRPTQMTPNPEIPPSTQSPRRVAVLLPMPFPEPYDYAVPDGMETPVPGAVVEVPLGPRRLYGAVWGPGGTAVDSSRLRPVVRVFDVPPLPEVARRFVDWVAAYTLTPPGRVLRMVLRVPAAFEPPRPLVAFERADAVPPPGFKLTAARKRVLEVLSEGPPRLAGEIEEEAACGRAVLRGLVEAGMVRGTARSATRFPKPDWRRPGPEFSAEQAAAVAELRRRAATGGKGTVSLDGVTGSGKTEVYFEAVAATLEAGRQALVLLPEIALSAQWLERFTRRFGAPPVEWHSDVSETSRRDAWRAVATGEARVVVGARSALFLPFPDLGLIVVDEEHETAYKQEDGVVYNARDMAVVRGGLSDIPVVLVSATPSLETRINVETGRYHEIRLPNRHGGAEMPEVRLIDLRRDPPPARRWLAPATRAAVTGTLERGEQAMLFLNRRGYAPLTLCRACGHRLRCPNCSAWLVEHRLSRRLRCHHCGHSQPLVDTCPECGAVGTMTPCGPGVERVAEEAAELWPDARLAVVASDTLFSPRAIQEMVGRVASHDLDLIVGTQILAKGHHFPMLTLVGVVDADLSLAGGDPRAGERTFQMLQQVAGRAGRAERPGRVLVQTHMPEHPVMAALAAGDRDGFYEIEAEMRRDAGMPPFGRLAALVVSGEDESEVDRVAFALGRSAPRSDEVSVLGPAPAPLALLRGRHRRRLLMRAELGVRVQPLIRSWLEVVEVPVSVRIQVDVDPVSFM